MKYFIISPPAKLRPFVRFFWVYEGEASATIPYVYRSMACGCPELIFHYKGRFKELSSSGAMTQEAYSLFHAQSDHFRRFITNENFGIFGAYLYPYTIPYLFGLPSCEISNNMPDLNTLLGNTGIELEERVMLASSSSERVYLVSQMIESRLAQHFIREEAIQASIRHVIYANQVPGVKELASVFNMSPRQLERKFKDYAGFSPKLYSRIIRFQGALNQYGSAKSDSRSGRSLTEIAFQCGYYDQSHFIHDFKRFSGYHPKQYFSGRAEGTEYREV